MDKSERKQHQDSATSYLDNVSDRYEFDSASGLYKQKAPEDPENSSTDTTGRYRRFPFWVNVKPDWFGLAISVATLILLGFTVHFARKQWKAMNATLGEVRKQTASAQESADASERSSLTAQRSERDTAKASDEELQQSKRSLQASIDNFHQEQRPWVGIQKITCDICTETHPAVPHPPGAPQSFKVDGLKAEIVNTGRSAAIQIHAEFMTKLVPINPMPTWDSFNLLYQGKIPTTSEFYKGQTFFKGFEVVGSGTLTLAPETPTDVELIPGGSWTRPLPDFDVQTVYIIGRITYTEGGSRARYLTSVCLMNSTWQQGQSFTFCPSGNDMK